MDWIADKVRTHIFIIFYLLAAFAYGQLDPPGVLQLPYPEFGTVSGAWGHNFYHRPFAGRGIVITDWRDLLTLNPINGEFINTNSETWHPQEPKTSYWELVHPKLVAAEDTAFTSVLVNYKQGSGDFSDFTAWYHTAMGKSTRVGWFSKLRSHVRFTDVEDYMDQRHRLQSETELSHRVLRTEIQYAKHLNPNYLFQIDTALNINVPRGDFAFEFETWNGSVELKTPDSLTTGLDIFFSIEGGQWKWMAGESTALRSMVYGTYRRPLINRNPVRLTLGYLINTFNRNRRNYEFSALTIPLFHHPNLEVDVGIKNLGKSYLLPSARLKIGLGPAELNYRIRHSAVFRLADPEVIVSNIHHASISTQTNSLHLAAGIWENGAEWTSADGYHVDMGFYLPWAGEWQLGWSQANGSETWIWSREQFSWGMSQDFSLFKQALNASISLQGRHLKNPQIGYLNPSSLIAEVQSNSSEQPGTLDLLDFSLSAQISSVVVSYTNSNFLQHNFWQKNLDSNLDTEFQIMSNESPSTRFAYLTIVWIFNG